MNMRLVLFEPDIAQHTGTLLRLAACLDVPVDIIEPCGFHMDDRRLRRAALAYLAALDLTRHVSWPPYNEDFYPAGRGPLALPNHVVAQPHYPRTKINLTALPKSLDPSAANQKPWTQEPETMNQKPKTRNLRSRWNHPQGGGKPTARTND